MQVIIDEEIKRSFFFFGLKKKLRDLVFKHQLIFCLCGQTWVCFNPVQSYELWEFWSRRILFLFFFWVVLCEVHFMVLVGLFIHQLKTRSFFKRKFGHVIDVGLGSIYYKEVN